jgi:hypothetical protein
MRKESIGRLLLTLLTAFVMVAGVFGAAVKTWSSNEATEGSNQATMEIAAGDIDTRPSVTGDAPVSAIDSETNELCHMTDLLSTSSTDSESNVPDIMQLDTKDDSGDSIDDMSPSAHGTRALPVDANGPYGEMPPNGTPYLEGDTVPFSADMIGGNNADYKFRWEVTGDDEYDGPGPAPDYWGAYDENTYSHPYKDNHVGVATAEAWDGVSMTTYTGGGDIWDGDTSYSWLMGGYLYITVGLQFQVNQDITIDELGVYRYGSYAYTYYNLRLWNADTQALMYSVNYPTTRLVPCFRSIFIPRNIHVKQPLSVLRR